MRLLELSMMAWAFGVRCDLYFVGCLTAIIAANGVTKDAEKIGP
jgi:hypothetical protein